MEVIAHRGMPRKARENTLAGFRLAVAQGVDGIELDVHASADGMIVVHHDPHLPPPGPRGAASNAPSGNVPVSEGVGASIARTPLAELRRVAPYEIPTLGEVLALVPPSIRLYVEVKAADIDVPLASLLSGHERRCAVHAFDHRIPRRMRDRLPGLPSGLLSSSYVLHPGRSLLESAAQDYWQRWEFIDDTLVRDVHAAGGRVVAWTVNAADDVRRLAAMGVDAICTDVADEVGDVARSLARG